MSHAAFRRSATARHKTGIGLKLLAIITAAAAAIEEDGAEVITFGCSGTFWLQPFVKEGLLELGWDIPVLEGYSTAITQAKLMVDLGVDASALLFPDDRPPRIRHRKVF